MSDKDKKYITKKKKEWITKKDPDEKSAKEKWITKKKKPGEAIDTRVEFAGGGRTNLLEELGRVEGESSNRNRRDEVSRIHSELNKGYKKGGRVGAKDGKWIQKVNKSIKARGTKGKCTPITKPGCTGRAKALAKTFKKMAKKRKAA